MFGQSLLSAFGIACTTDTDQLFTTDQSVTSTATYQLNNATTSIPSNTYPGTASNITYAAGKFGNAAVFNGSSSVIDVSSSAINPASPYTISMWFNASNAASYEGLYTGISSSPVVGEITVVKANATTIQTFSVATNGSNILDANTVTVPTLSNSTWYNLVFIADRSLTYKSRVFINGVEGTNYTVGSASTNLLSTIKIGFADNNYFDGLIDQVRFFASSLPQAAITALYNETTTTAQSSSIDYQLANPNSVAYYKMSDATDQLGNYNGTATNVNFNTEGKFGFAGAFNGSSSTFFLASAGTSVTNYDSDFSVSMWFNVSSWASGASTDFLWTGGGTRIVNIHLTGSYGLAFDLWNSGSNIVSTTGLSENIWYNLVITRSKTAGMVLYINGASVDTNSFTGNAGNLSSQDSLGTYWNNTRNNFTGKIDQVRIYDSAISAADVTTLYKEVECEPAAINALNHFNTVLYTGDGASSRSITGVGFAPNFTWTKKRGPSTANHLLQNTVQGAGTGSALYSASNGSAGSMDQYGYISAFGIDGVTYQAGSSGSYPSDLNNENNSTYVAWNWKAPLANLSTEFNSNRQGQITLPSSITTPWNTSSEFGVSCWINPNTWGSSQQTMAFYFNGANSGNIGFDREPGGNFRCFVTTSGGSFIGVNSSNNLSATNKWYHIVFTGSAAAGVKLYVDGVNTGSASWDGTYVNSTGTNSIGVSPQSLRGNIAQFRVYSSYLTASEVSDLYTEPAASNNTLNYPAGAGCIAAYPLQTDAVDLSGNYSGASSNVTFGHPGYLTSNTDGTITSEVAVNQEAGFSIVKYTGNEQASQTVGHGLSGSPEIAFIKQLDGGRDWAVPLFTQTPGDYMYLNSSQTKSTDTNKWSAVSSTTFTVGADPYTNGTGSPYIAYCFKSIPGYSKIGSYIGQTNGVTIYTGFQPRFIMVKASQATYPENWAILDAARGSGKCLNPNLGNAETDSALNTFTTTATGFSFPNQNIADAMLNENGYSYIFLAIA